MSDLQPSELSILLVESSSTQLKIIQRHLQQAGVLKVEGVPDAQSALDFISRYPPDLVISAMYLPDMTAVELLTQLRELPQTQQCMFMLVSSETDQAMLDPLRQAGVVAILPKPFDAEDLQRALRTTVDHIDPEELSLQHYDVAQIKVLVVDDSLTSRNHLSRVMAGLGIGQIINAENGTAAIRILQQEDFDLIVTDLNMPEVDGQQLIDHIRLELKNSYIPILLVTSEQNQSRLEQVQQSGVSAILDKPFEPENIREILYRVLD